MYPCERLPESIFSSRREVQETPLAILVRGLYLTLHAKEQMCSRSISVSEVCAAVDHGRIHHDRGAVIYAVGKHEAELSQADLGGRGKLEGLQVVCSIDKRIITVYRNVDLRILKPQKRHHCGR